ncbi:dodecenoyl-CoA isomerase [Lobulomyces angularis]|nr:dodecenoyl-CoA isomerase [Lobulomyces angularis]
MCLKRNSPPVNSLTNEFFKEFSKLLRDTKNDSNVHGLIIETLLPNVFSAGLDLNYIRIPKSEPREEAEKRLKNYFLNFQDMLKELATYPNPTVALVRGSAPAGGTVIASLTDYKIGIENKRFTMGFSEVAVGLAPPNWINFLSQRHLGLKNGHKYVALGTLTNDIHEAKSLGFLDEVCANNDLALESAIKQIEINLVPPTRSWKNTKLMQNQELVKMMNTEAVDFFWDSLGSFQFQESVKDIMEGLKSQKK